jgi:N-acetylmuramoyl-L-alanine amidase CwlA
MEIKKKLIKYNFTPDANNPIYIVVHDTGNFNADADSEMHYKYFNKGSQNASAHFFVDDKQILQLIEVKDKSWNCGDGTNKYGINNGNTISIEMCVNAGSNRGIMLKNTIELTVYLMKTYNISIDKVIRHFDASRKTCPQTMNNNGDWAAWESFKNSVKKSLMGEVINMFNDEDKIAGWAKPSVDKLANLGLIKGDNNGNVNPENFITRQEFFVVIDRLLALFGK